MAELRAGAVVYCDGTGNHDLTHPHFNVDRLTYLERAKLWATLTALADIVDPGEYRDWQTQQQMTRSILTGQEGTDT